MNTSGHILIVDDDPEIRELLCDYLISQGYQATAVADGQAMRAALADASFDLIVLDLMLPGEDGFTLCRELRTESTIPIIMLTARGDDTDRIVGLEIGADDYMPKPFNPRELVARIKVVLRRTRQSPEGNDVATAHQLAFADWTLDVDLRHLIAGDGVVVPLSGAEFKLLYTFLQNAQRILSRDQLLNFTRGRDAAPFDRSIDVQVARLRTRLNYESHQDKTELIKTVRGEGYLFTATVKRVR